LGKFKQTNNTNEGERTKDEEEIRRERGEGKKAPTKKEEECLVMHSVCVCVCVCLEESGSDVMFVKYADANRRVVDRRGGRGAVFKIVDSRILMIMPSTN